MNAQKMGNVFAAILWAAIGLALLLRLEAGQIEGVLVLLALAPLYFMPAILAKGRKHRQLEAIAALNLLLGWTVLGWIAALVWALTQDNSEKYVDL